MNNEKLPYEKYRIAGDLIFVSGQLPIDLTTGEIGANDIKGQTNQIMFNFSQLLTELNASMDDVVKTTCFLTDMANFESFNQVYAQYFNERFPARSAFQVGALPKGALVEIEWVIAKR